jgi:hypothetical protein
MNTAGKPNIILILADDIGVIDWSILEQHPAMDWHKPQKPEN